MDGSSIDWAALDRLRTAFLEGSAGSREYWEKESDLASYDLTFAQRIGWKWDFVLKELDRLSWVPPAGPVLDWGCGSGIAHRVFFDHFGVRAGAHLQVADRSLLAQQFALRRARERFPGLPVEALSKTSAPFGTMLVSHVLTELDDPAVESLLELVAQATAVLWVEPGTHSGSRSLLSLRERLRPNFPIVAPCTHQHSCGMLAPENQRHWCHHFAPPPPQVFTDPHWGRFAAMAGIDLRAVPLSYLVLDKRPRPPLLPTTLRVIGQPRVYKAHALFLSCAAGGLGERRLSKRTLPNEFRHLKKGQFSTFQTWHLDGNEITGGHSIDEEAQERT